MSNPALAPELKAFADSFSKDVSEARSILMKQGSLSALVGSFDPGDTRLELDALVVVTICRLADFEQRLMKLEANDGRGTR